MFEADVMGKSLTLTPGPWSQEYGKTFKVFLITQWVWGHLRIHDTLCHMKANKQTNKQAIIRKPNPKQIASNFVKLTSL